MFTTYMKHQGDSRRPALVGHSGLKRRRAIDGEFRPNPTGKRLITQAKGTIKINKRPISYKNIAPQKTQSRASLEDGQVPMVNTFDLVKEQQAVKDLYTKTYKEKLAQEQARKMNLGSKLNWERLINKMRHKKDLKKYLEENQGMEYNDDQLKELGRVPKGRLFSSLNKPQTFYNNPVWENNANETKPKVMDKLRRQLEYNSQQPSETVIKEEIKPMELPYFSPALSRKTPAIKSPQLDMFSLDLTPQLPILEKTREQLWRAILTKIPEEDRNPVGKNTFRYKGNIFSYGNNKDSVYADKKTLQQIAQQTGAGKKKHKSMNGRGNMWLDAILQNIF